MGNDHSEKTEPVKPKLENNTEFKIEQNISVPEVRSKTIYPFHLMEVNDSFFMPGDKAKSKLANAAFRFAKGKMKKFMVRAIVDGNNKLTGARCWRVE